MTHAPKRASVLRSAYGGFAVLVRNHHLIWELAKRDVLSRYRGSIMGLFWTLFQPLMMLAVYTLVFGIVFKARWPQLAAGDDAGGLQFAAVLFSGLIVHAFFGDCLSQATGLINQNANLVKKLVFPIEILAWTLIGSTLFRTAISLLILLGFVLLAFGRVPATALLLPVVLAPLVLMSAGMVWLISALGVFVRDLGQVIGILVTVLLFFSPVFFPIEALPESIAPYVYWNPITLIVVQLRNILLWGHMPDWSALLTYTGVALAACWLGFHAFCRLRRAFADVL